MTIYIPFRNYFRNYLSLAKQQEMSKHSTAVPLFVTFKHATSKFLFKRYANFLQSQVSGFASFKLNRDPPLLLALICIGRYGNQNILNRQPKVLWIINSKSYYS